MRKTRLSLLLSASLAAGIVTLAGCQVMPPQEQPAPGESAMTGQNARFAQVSESLLMRALERSPEWSIHAGRYDNAATLTIPDAANRAGDLAFAEAGLAELAAFDPARLAPDQRIDHQLLKNRFESTRWYQTTFRDWAWNPSRYNVAGPIAVLLNTPYADEDVRLRTVPAR